MLLSCLVLVAVAGCASDTATPNAASGSSPTPTLTATSTPTLTPTLTPTSTPTSTPTPTQTTTPSPIPGAGGPYAVEQTQSLGGEKISGLVCDLAKPFLVNSVTPKVTFNFVFVPAAADRGKVTYAYSIPSAGESHDAAGTYTIQPLARTVKLVLSLTVSDHVVFKGFNGSIPNRYSFNLVPNSNVPCP